MISTIILLSVICLVIFLANSYFKKKSQPLVMPIIPDHMDETFDNSEISSSFSSENTGSISTDGISQEPAKKKKKYFYNKKK
jgi:regulatory protein YycI of two-component signal transduction system YycFG